MDAPSAEDTVSPMLTEFDAHLREMVDQETTFTVGLTNFYKANGKKNQVWKTLKIQKNWTWQKRLDARFPGVYRIDKNRIYLASAMPKRKVAKRLKKGGSSEEMGDLEAHIESWVARVAKFNGKKKNRKTPSAVKKNGLGQACPTCQQQMTAKGRFIISAEHIVPLGIGGDNTITGRYPQVIAMCLACNTARNKTVLAIKDKNRGPLVEFLIRQVYDKTESKLHPEYLSMFQRFYLAATGLEPKTRPEQAKLLIVGGFVNNNPSSIMELVSQNLDAVPRQIIHLIEQKDSKRLDIGVWSPFTDDIKLISNGRDNLQCSVILEAKRHNDHSIACLLAPGQSGDAFEVLLKEMGVTLLHSSPITKKPARNRMLNFSKFLPWNWFSSTSQKPNSTEGQNQLQHFTDEETESQDLPSNIATTASTPPTLDWATPEQLEIITDIKQNLVAEIHNMKQQGRDFRVNGMAPIYYSYGGSAAVKELLGFPKNTKMKEMFSKLYGDAFVFSGEAPLWIVNTSLKEVESPSENSELDADLEPEQEDNAPPGMHTIEIFRNKIIEEVERGDGKLTMEEIRDIAHSIKVELEMSWKEYNMEFGLKNHSGGVEGWVQNFTLMLELAGLEFQTEPAEEEVSFIFSKNILPLPGLEETPLASIQLAVEEPHTLAWANPEQVEIIHEVKESLKSNILELKQTGGDFQMKHLGQIYKPYGGSKAFKKKMGVLSSTKIQDMFVKLFGDEFVFSGSSPFWVIDLSDQGHLNAEEEQ